METRTTRRKKPGIKNKRKSKTKPSSEGFFNNKYSATERQYLKKELKEETPPASKKHDIIGDKYSDPDNTWRSKDWLGYSHILESIGGKFLHTLSRLSLLSLDEIYVQRVHMLIEKIVVAPNGVICGNYYEKDKLKKLFKKDK